MMWGGICIAWVTQSSLLRLVHVPLRGRDYVFELMQHVCATSSVSNRKVVVPVQTDAVWANVNLNIGEGKFVWLPGTMLERCLADVASIKIPNRQDHVDLFEIWRFKHTASFS